MTPREQWLCRPSLSHASVFIPTWMLPYAMPRTSMNESLQVAGFTPLLSTPTLIGGALVSQVATAFVNNRQSLEFILASTVNAQADVSFTMAAIAANTYNISWSCGVPVSWSPPIDYNGTVPDIWAKTPPFVYLVTFSNPHRSPCTGPMAMTQEEQGF
jgi:hypothetical protein